MDGNNWRGGGQGPMVQPLAGTVEQLALSNSDGAPPVDPDDWRAQLPLDSRQRNVNEIMETLKKHLPFSGQEGLRELTKIAVRFEEKIYSAATSKSDYLRKISLKMLTMETRSQTPMANSLQPGAANASRNPSDLASHGMQSQIHNPGLAMPIVGGQPQGRQQLLSQNMQNNVSAAGMQSSGSLASTLPAVSNLTQGSIVNAVGQNSNLQNMQNNSNVAQNSVMGQGMPSNIFANSQRQMQGRQQQVPPQQQQQQQPQNQAHLLYNQQLQQQLMKQKLQPGGMTQPMMQSHAQKQQQQHQNIIQTGQMQSSQQAMQPSMMQSASLSGLQPNHQSSGQQSNQQMLEQQPQQVPRQHQQQQAQQVPILHQQQTSMAQQPMMQTAQQMQQQPLTGQVSSDSSIQQNSLIGQQNNIQDLQQQHRLMGQQNNIANLQQQQLISQQNNVPNMHQPQLGGGVSGLQQSTSLGMQSIGSSGMPSIQHSVHMLQQKVPVQQQMQQNVSLMQNQTQQSQTQPSQQQMVSQIQPQSGQMQHMQMQSNSMQRDMQQRLPTSGAMLQQQNLVEQQKQFFQSQRAMQEASSTSLDSTAETGNAGTGDWQEEVYQKVKSMKDVYLLELNEMYVKIATKLQQHDALPQPTKNEQLSKLKFFKVMLERLVQFLRLSKNEIQIDHKDKLLSIEKQIVNILNSNKPRKPASSLQPGQLPQPGMQNTQPQSQISQMRTHENQMNPHMQPMNPQTSAATMAQNNLSALHHNTLPSVTSISNSHQNMMNSLQSSSSSELGQNSSLLSPQQVAVNSLQQNNTLSGPQSVNLAGSLTSQAGVNTLQSNLNSLQTNSSMLQNQHLRQQEQQMLHSQQLKRQMHHKQMQQQLFNNQQLLQPQQQQPQQQQHQMKQQQSAQIPGHTMSPLHQISDSSDVKMRQQMGVKPGVFQQHQSSNQRAAAYASQQVKPGSPFSIPSPQVFQAGSPQVLQHPSPQISQQNLVTSMKTGTPLHSANSPFIVPSPSTPVAPSPMHGESEKLNASLSSHPNTNIGHLQAPNATGSSAQSLAIGTPGISASPLLAEFTSLDGAHGNTSTVISGRSNAVERPIERLIKAVKSASQKALSSSVSDISSVVSMIDRIAGSAPGNGSRAAVGEDLVAMTKCRLQARNFFAQDGPAVTKKLRRSTIAMPSIVASSAGSVNNSVMHLAGSDAFDLESTATSSLRRPKMEPNHALVDEIHDINRRLIDTLVEISDEDVDSNAVVAVAEGGKGTIVKCSFTAVALSPRLKSQYASAQMSPIQPLRMLIPINYPNCSPILLDKFPVEVSKEFEDLSMKAKSRFTISLRSLSQPMSLTEMAKTWDNCARVVISEFAQQSGGGSFSSKYGTWENCISAS